VLGRDACAHHSPWGLKATQAGFARAARAARTVAEAGLPTAIVQEGGYLCDALPLNLAAFLGVFDEARM
jgi:acetoin utilization deacetylase AcuC-like enzyme